MQCSPTKPGLKFKKFHLVAAASSTSWVSMPNNPNIYDSSLTKAMLISRCEFSITFAASATLILEALYVPAVIIDLYS